MRGESNFCFFETSAGWCELKYKMLDVAGEVGERACRVFG